MKRRIGPFRFQYPKAQKYIFFLFVPADEVGRGHKNGERPSVRACVRLSVRPGFPTRIWKSNHSIYFKFGVCIFGAGVQNWLAFGPRWPNFDPLVAKKMTENRSLAQKIFTQSNSDLWCTLVGWVFRIDSLLGHVGQILALLVTTKWLKMVVCDHFLKNNLRNPIQISYVHLLSEGSELIIFWDHVGQNVAL